MKKFRFLPIFLTVFALTACNDYGNEINATRAKEVAESIFKKASDRKLDDYSKGFSINTKTTYSATSGLDNEVYTAIGLKKAGSFEQLISYYPKEKVVLVKNIETDEKNVTTVTEEYTLLKNDTFYSLSVNKERKIGIANTNNAALHFSESVMNIINSSANDVDSLIGLTTVDEEFIFRAQDPYESSSSKFYSLGNGNITVESKTGFSREVQSSYPDIVFNPWIYKSNRVLQFKDYLEDSDKITTTVNIGGSTLDKKFELTYETVLKTKVTWKATKFTVPNLSEYSISEAE